MMKCPIDDEPLAMTERSGVEIDYCPKCRGIWLDRGELDKIVERSDAEPRSLRPTPQLDEGYGRSGGHHGGRSSYKKSRRKNLLSDLLDF